jgi:hypothetical protein
MAQYVSQLTRTRGVPRRPIRGGLLGYARHAPVLKETPHDQKAPRITKLRLDVDLGAHSYQPAGLCGRAALAWGLRGDHLRDRGKREILHHQLPRCVWTLLANEAVAA